MERVIHIHPNRTGGSSIRRLLRIKHQPQHLNAKELKAFYPEYAKAYTFSFVRNPFARVVSLFEFKSLKRRIDRKEPLVFANWIHKYFVAKTYKDDPRYYQTCSWWVCDGGSVAVDDLYRFERFSDEVERLRGHLVGLGIKRAGIIPHIKPASWGCDYREYYKGDTRRIIADYFMEDLERFGYEF